jgi:hypothetical protein
MSLDDHIREARLGAVAVMAEVEFTMRLLEQLPHEPAPDGGEELRRVLEHRGDVVEVAARTLLARVGGACNYAEFVVTGRSPL